jgi:hypothetical protein
MGTQYGQDVRERYHNGKVGLHKAVVELCARRVSEKASAKLLGVSLGEIYRVLCEVEVISTAEAICELYQADKTSTGMSVAQDLSISYGRVYQVLRAHKIPIKPRPKKLRAPAPPKTPRDRVIDKIFRYLEKHPNSTVAEVARGIGHPNQGTVGQILSRQRVQGYVQALELEGAADPHLWALSEKAGPLLKESHDRLLIIKGPEL